MGFSRAARWLPTPIAKRHFLGGFGKTLVDHFCFLRPAGHGRDEDGRIEFFAEQVEGRVNRFEVKFRQGLVDEVVIIPVRWSTRRGHPAPG